MCATQIINSLRKVKQMTTRDGPEKFVWLQQSKEWFPLIIPIKTYQTSLHLIMGFVDFKTHAIY
jgi:hypothetical protein